MAEGRNLQKYVKIRCAYTSNTTSIDRVYLIAVQPFNKLVSYSAPNTSDKNIPEENSHVTVISAGSELVYQNAKTTSRYYVLVL